MLDRLIRRPVSVTMVLLVLMVLGIIGITKLPVSLIPDIDIPQVTVQITDGSKSARELDESVVAPLRQSLLQVEYLKDIRSESRDGSSTITLTFEEGRDIDYIYIEINEKIDRAMASLPRMEHPKVFKASATDIPAFYINLTLKDGSSHAAKGADTVLYPVSEEFRQMSDFACNVISKRLEQLPEVAMVDVSGTVGSEILIIPDIEALRSLGLSVEDFERYVSSANVTLSNLTIRDGEYHYNVKFESFATGRKDIESVWFTSGGRTLQIKDVAKVIEHPSERGGMDTSDGDDAVILAVIKQGDSKMSDLRKAISTQMESFRADYPGIEFTVTRDQTELLDYSIHNLLMNIILAILLDCIVIFLFMKDLRTPVLVALTIPSSLVISFFVFYVIGLTINIISLSGLLLGIGMMVDNTIILTDNITARWQRGENLHDAVINGTKEVVGPMLSSVLTTCAVFIPLVFLNGLAGSLFFDQAIAVTVVLLTSYVITITVIPVYYWALYKKLPAFQPNRYLSRIEFKGATGLYDRIVSFFLANRRVIVLIPALCAAVIAVCVIWMPKEKLPPISYTDAMLKVDWNEHVTLEENSARVAVLESSIREISEQISSMIGVQQFALGHSGDQAMNQAGIYFKCRDSRTLEEAKRTLQEVISSRWPAAVSGIVNSGNIFDMVFSEKEPQLLAKLRPAGIEGMNVDKLRHTLADIREAVPEIAIDEISLKTDVLYVSDPEMMALYGVSFNDLVSVLENSLNGNVVYDIVNGSRTVPVVLGTDVREMEDILAKTFIKDIPLSVVMRQSWEQDFRTLVSGEDGNYYPLPLDISAKDVRSTMAKITEAVRESGDFSVSFSGSYFSNLNLLREMAVILLIAVLLLFLILASQFESLVQPFIILSEIIIDIAVCLGALWLLGVSINLMSLIGLVVICGIVINDSILKIDTINRLVKDGAEIEAAVHEAGHRRLKAIIMTSVTTILAIAPFLSRGSMGDDLQYPMALVIIIGMTVGTLISLFFVPAVYSAIYSRRK